MGSSQPWCNGNIGLSGVSFLAISQYYVAACEAYGGSPPALKCISPWEGLSDPLRGTVEAFPSPRNRHMSIPFSIRDDSSDTTAATVGNPEAVSDSEGAGNLGSPSWI